MTERMTSRITGGTTLTTISYGNEKGDNRKQIPGNSCPAGFQVGKLPGTGFRFQDRGGRKGFPLRDVFRRLSRTFNFRYVWQACYGCSPGKAGNLQEIRGDGSAAWRRAEAIQQFSIKKNRPGGEPGTAVKMTDGELGKETSQR